MSAGTQPIQYRASKTYRCDWCGESIDIGDRYWRWRWFSDDGAATCKAHPECHDALHEQSREEGNYVEFTIGSNAKPAKDQP